MANEGMSAEEIRAAASASVAAGGDVREHVRELTLKALKERKFDFAGMREVLRAMTEGVNLGVEKGGHDARKALSDAFAGMDQAMSKAAQAGSLAMKEMADKGRAFSQTELKQGLEQMRKMETDFLDTVKQVSQSASGSVKSNWQDLLIHAQRAGTDTGRVVAETSREFSARMVNTMSESALAGMEAARAFGERFASLASGILAGMSEALRPDEEGKKK